MVIYFHRIASIYNVKADFTDKFETHISKLNGTFENLN